MPTNPAESVSNKGWRRHFRPPEWRNSLYFSLFAGNSRGEGLVRATWGSAHAVWLVATAGRCQSCWRCIFKLILFALLPPLHVKVRIFLIRAARAIHTASPLTLTYTRLPSTAETPGASWLVVMFEKRDAVTLTRCDLHRRHAAR
jgi:hypothetical protein